MKEKYLKKLLDLENSNDLEMIHGEADNILCKLLIELGYKEIVEAFESLDKWYS